MPGPIFHDPQRRRWKRLRRLFDAVGLVTTLLVIFFVITVFTKEPLPKLLLPDLHKPYRALKEKEHRRPRTRGVHRVTKSPPSQVVLNSGEGIRAAFYVTWDAASYSSLREYLPQIDLLYPEWLHVLTPDGHLQAVRSNNTLFDALQNGTVQQVDDKVMPLLKQEKAQTEVFPLVNNFDPIGNEWSGAIEGMLNNPDARKRFRQEIAAFLSTDKYRGINLDFEAFPVSAQPAYRVLVKELLDDLHARGMKLYVSMPAHNEDFDYAYIAANSDGVVLMNYDEHYPGGKPGPIASQEWFTENLASALKVIPSSKLICAVANYGYDWSMDVKKPKQKLNVRNRSVQEAWLDARDSEADVEFDPDAMNPHFAYLDEPSTRHEIWFTDAVTALNQMRAAQKLGINTFALWRLGSEDRSLWAVWDQPGDPAAPEKLRTVPPGQDVDMEGTGEILEIGSRPKKGERSVEVDPETGIISDENFSALPSPYMLNRYGSQDKQFALTFDDGPDPKYTPLILDTLKAKNAKATFFVIGEQAEKFAGVTKRIYREEHEIGNHTWTHPDISGVPRTYMRVELNLTEKFLEGKLGVRTLLFRPPYSIDQEPDTGDEVRPLEISQEMGYITVGNRIDPDDWQNNPHHSAEQITADVMKQLPRGNIILLHDGGGNRSETVRAVPMIIDELRARGYEVVTISQLLGKHYTDVMSPLPPSERWSALLDSLGFWVYGMIISTIVFIFFIGDILMSARLLLVGAGAIYDRFRRSRLDENAEATYKPAVAVLVPAYNEEKVIVRTVRSVLASDYPNLRVIVIDDGSTDGTLKLARDAFQQEVTSGRVLILTKSNSGKAETLNFGLTQVWEEVFVGIDADTVIASDAISRLVPHFSNQKVAALAGNAKVGNRVNLWTRWQALEYITSQNFERRALNVLGAVSVVPGAIGAWRTSAVRAEGGYHADTVAEDADLTMRLLRKGCRVEYEDRALAYTEAPSSANGLMRQRFRWSFGILQSVWKHRDVFTRKGVLGWVALPNILIFQILLPLVSPFIDLMFVFGLLNYLVDKHFHPETANPANLHKLLAFFLTFLMIDFIASALAFALERRRATDRRENIWLLGHVWFQRLAYRQLFSIVLIKTLKRAAEGRPFAWDKLERTAAVHYTLHENEAELANNKAGS